MLLAKLIVVLITIAIVGLGVYALGRAPGHRPARWFLFYTLGIGCFNIGSIFGPLATDPQSSLWITTFLIGGLILLETALVLLLGALFVPQWWQGNRPIRWIVLPYVALGTLVMLDMLAGLGLFIGPMARNPNGTYALTIAEPGGTIMVNLFYASWLLH